MYIGVIFFINGGGFTMPRSMSIQSYRDLEVWQRGIDLVEQVYGLSDVFPPEEKFGLKAQVRRAAVSIPSNIAEGWSRNSTKDYIHFLTMARSSLHEVETQVIIAYRLGYIAKEVLNSALSQTETESKMLLSLIRSLSK